MRHKRAKNYLVGLSSILPKFSSEWFDVYWVTANNGKHTTISVIGVPDLVMNIDGHHEMASDDDCIEEMEIDDLDLWITYVTAEGFRVGDMYRSSEMRKCMGISSNL